MAFIRPNNSQIIISAGVIPIEQNGKVVGAISISRGSGAQDRMVPAAEISAF